MKITDIAADEPVPEDIPPEALAAQPLPKHIRTGRNLPVAIGVGVVLGGLALLTLLTVKATFLIYMGVALAIGLHELAAALKTRDITVPVIPVALGGAAMLTAAYWAAGGAVLAAFALTVLGDPGLPHVRRHRPATCRDVTAGVFATAYLPLLGATVAAMLAPPDGGKRVLIFIILTICSDIGGYFAGITLTPFTGGHKMAPVISPEEDLGRPRGLRCSSASWPARSCSRPCSTATGGRASSPASRPWPPPSSATWPSP